jgi:hypothetical protein
LKKPQFNLQTLSFNIGFKSLLPQRDYQIEADNLSALYSWIKLKLPVLQPILFNASDQLNPFICILRNQQQVDCMDLELPLSKDDRIEILLPMSGG